jgi:hypothetical protein
MGQVVETVEGRELFLDLSDDKEFERLCMLEEMNALIKERRDYLTAKIDEQERVELEAQGKSYEDDIDESFVAIKQVYIKRRVNMLSELRWYALMLAGQRGYDDITYTDTSWHTVTVANAGGDILTISDYGYNGLVEVY